MGAYTLRPLSNRVLVRPLRVTSANLVIDVNEDDPVLGRVVQVGPRRCEACDEPLDPDVVPDALIVMRPNYYQDVTFNGERLWMIDHKHILGLAELTADETAALDLAHV